MNKISGSDKFKTLFPYFILALAIIIAYRITGEAAFFVNIVRQAWSVLLPFLYGFILAYIVNIPIVGIQKLLIKTNNKWIIRKQKMLSVLIIFVITVVVITLILNWIIPAIADSILFFIASIPEYWERTLQFVDYFNALDLFGWYISVDAVFNLLRDIFADFNFENLLQPLTALMGVGTAVFNGVIAFISSIYILVEKEKFKKYLSNLLRVFTSKGVNTAIAEIFSRLNENFRQYIRTQTIDGVILGTMATILLFILGSPYALVLGIMLGVVNYIPYFGSIFGSVFVALVIVLTQGIMMGIISAGLLLVIQQIDANIIQPRLMSGSFALSPLLVIISISIGGAMAGVFGMIVAIPIIAVLKDIFDSIVEYYDRKKFGDAKKVEKN